jgi:hypothetical protein
MHILIFLCSSLELLKRPHQQARLRQVFLDLRHSVFSTVEL